MKRDRKERRLRHLWCMCAGDRFSRPEDPDDSESNPYSPSSNTYQGNARFPPFTGSKDCESPDADVELRGSISCRYLDQGKQKLEAAMSLTRTHSLSLAITQQAAISCTLRKAHSIPLEEWVKAAAEQTKLNTGYHLVLPATDASQESRAYASSAGDLYEVEEPRTVSKDLMRSISQSIRGHEALYGEFDELEYHPSYPAGKESINCYVYILDCRTGRSVSNHVELRKAMDALRHWRMQAPGNCCLTFKHDSGEVVTLPWPDLEAGAPEEVEEFVNAINRIERRHVFSTCYRRSPYLSTKSMVPSSPPSTNSTGSATSMKSMLSASASSCPVNLALKTNSSARSSVEPSDSSHFPVQLAT